MGLRLLKVLGSTIIAQFVGSIRVRELGISAIKEGIMNMTEVKRL
jgi:hypothetical protein